MTDGPLEKRLKKRLAEHPRLFRMARHTRQALRSPERLKQALRSPERFRRERLARAGKARLVPSPVFVICPVRSGSTLLRVVLNSHPEIRAPHELHLRSVRVQFERRYGELAMNELSLDNDELEHMLWDRILHRELVSSGKRILVDKTPANATFVDRLVSCWPDARFIFLLRHPASIVASLMETRPDRELEPTVREALLYLDGVEAARQSMPGLEVRYEDLTGTPTRTTKRICEFLGTRWDRSMLEYGQRSHGTFRAGIGDWSTKIRTGRIQKARPLPKPIDVPEGVRPIARAWGYLP
ncbi:sulfotransferase family protein [Actinopolymorpha alba]|uniref:sulfotransferase family protein n=1 Tax=Actinopolymorpha alba TaxID=533267 RepID=UPI00035C80A0|nr:sulfotransferase [Actinopolymorpha alba]